MSTATRGAAVAGAPAVTRREAVLWAADEKNGRHWLGVTCWCGAEHGGEEAGMTLVPSPWDEARSGETAG